MNEKYIYHNSYSELYRQPFGAVPAGTEVTLRLLVDLNSPPEKVTLFCWKDGTEPVGHPMELVDINVNGVSRAYEAKVTAENPGLLWYYFQVSSHGHTHYWGNNWRHLGGVGQMAESPPPAYQITVYKPNASTPGWFKDGVMYQIFVDRFYNGCQDGKVLNPKAKSLIHGRWDDTPLYLKDHRGDIERWNFFGGNLLGVIKKLPYLKELGISVIYLNPIFEAPSNHKYDTADYLNVDSMFGDNETFETLCRVAKELGIHIILDGVFSHTGSDSIYFNRDGNYSELGAYQSQDSPYYSWYRFTNFPNEYEAWWGVETLPNVNELEPSYQRFIIENENSVINTWMNRGAKGWRLDVVDELPGEFVKKLNKAVKSADPDAVIIGEVWEDASNKSSYGSRREYFHGDELDSVMNYPFRHSLINFALGHWNAEETNQQLMSLYENYPKHNFYAAMNILGSHDVERILTVLGGEQGMQRLKLLALFQMTFPGVPCVYYGDEVGMEGGDDPYCRGTYPWGRENTELLNWYKQIIGLRNSHDLFKTGEWKPVYAQGDVYAYLRTISNGVDVFGQKRETGSALVAFNRSPHEHHEITLKLEESDFHAYEDILGQGADFSISEDELRIQLQPLQGRVLIGRGQSI
ncbi:4-alpha-glucanotransferase [Desulfitispora alkaliphila]|uniref:glycoside hydrolase family 13 protein n=1 Tax=Desulfitispora alkaliphila TaxID=622674 RepID=UPI003D193739